MGVTLPFDICRCEPKANQCAEKDNCLRFLALPESIGYRANVDFSALLEPGKGCIYMIRADI